MREKFAERNKRIRELRGVKSVAEIAQELGVSYASVNNVFWRMDHPRPRKSGPRIIKQLGLEAFRAGLTVQDIRALAAKQEAA